MSPDTRNQLQLSVELAELTKKSNPERPDLAVQQIIEQCLNRDTGWKAFYNARVRDAVVKRADINSDRIALTEAEREAYRLAAINMAADGKVKLEQAIDKAQLADEEKGLYLQRLARITYLVDQAQGMHIQQGARERNIGVSIPPALPRKPASQGGIPAAERFRAWFLGFSQANAAVIAAKRIADQLDLDAKPKIVEAAIKELGTALGAESSRPEEEFGEGPDNLWFWGGRAYVIEAKSGNQETLHKSDSGQLHDSIQWAIEGFPDLRGRVIPIVVAKVCRTDGDAHFPEATRVLMKDGCHAIGVALHQLCQKLAQQGPLFMTPDNIQKEMAALKLLPEQFLGNHTRELD